MVDSPNKWDELSKGGKEGCTPSTKERLIASYTMSQRVSHMIERIKQEANKPVLIGALETELRLKLHLTQELNKYVNLLKDVDKEFCTKILKVILHKIEKPESVGGEAASTSQQNTEKPINTAPTNVEYFPNRTWTKTDKSNKVDGGDIQIISSTSGNSTAVTTNGLCNENRDKQTCTPVEPSSNSTKKETISSFDANDNRGPAKCFVCDEIGHIAKYCPKIYGGRDDRHNKSSHNGKRDYDYHGNKDHGYNDRDFRDNRKEKDERHGRKRSSDEYRRCHNRDRSRSPLRRNNYKDGTSW